MTPAEALKVAMETAARIISEEISASLIRLGEECVARIRTRSKEESWVDQTGNLRSSIGYAVFEYGHKLMSSAFDSVPGPDGSGAEGSMKGKQFIESLARQYADTYALVVVAGMDYAEYVEAMKGKDVLASTELWARARVDRYLTDARARAENRINDFIDTL